MQFCEYSTNLRVDWSRRGAASFLLWDLGLSIRVLEFPNHGSTPMGPYHAIQVNYGEVVLWRRWTCGPCRMHRHKPDLP